MPHESSVSPVQHLTAPQLAVRLNLTPDHLRRAVLGQPGGIPGIKLGKGPRSRWRIQVSDVERWEKDRTVCYDAAPQRRRH